MKSLLEKKGRFGQVNQENEYNQIENLNQFDLYSFNHESESKNNNFKLESVFDENEYINNEQDLDY